jgi:hypothetical protein
MRRDHLPVKPKRSTAGLTQFSEVIAQRSALDDHLLNRQSG